MIARRWMGVGTVAAVFVGGCASNPPPAKPADRPGLTPATPAATPGSPADRPQWEADARKGQTPQQLADRAAFYAGTMGGADPSTGGTAAAAPARSSPSGVRFDAPVAPAAPAAAPIVPPPVAAAVAVPPVAPAPRAGVLGSAARTSPLSDLPQEVPESADFAPTPSAVAAGPATDPLGRRLAQRAHDHPRDAAAQLDYQLYQQLNDGPEPSIPMLASDVNLPADERDVVSALTDGLANFRSGLRADPNAPTAQQLKPLAEMMDRLRAGSDLAISTVALCRRVDGFARYDPITPARFPLGRSSQVIVYCEVDNFLPQRSADGKLWETKLAQQVSIFTPGGQPVWEDKPRGVTDACRDRRRDFFAYEKVTLPPTLPAGTYRLKVTVTDRNANKVAESDVPLTIGV